jgi:hypothetical protein
LLAPLQPEIETEGAAALPSSALGQAACYTLTLWRRLTRFLEYPEIELSDNLAENSMRPIALGRKNRIHLGSPKAGPKVAAILSIVESCRRMKIPARDYLPATRGLHPRGLGRPEPVASYTALSRLSTVRLLRRIPRTSQRSSRSRLTTAVSGAVHWVQLSRVWGRSAGAVAALPRVSTSIPALRRANVCRRWASRFSIRVGLGVAAGAGSVGAAGT